MSFPSWQSLMQRVCFFSCASILMAGLANAQSAVPNSSSVSDSSSSAGWSSSQPASIQLADAAVPGNPAALPSAPSPAGSSAAQENSGGSGLHPHEMLHNLAFEVGGGFNAPSGDKQYITWGGQLDLGAGVDFTNRLAVLMEYQYLDDKLPGHLIAEAGATGGYAHIWSLTLAPVIDLFPKSSNDLYVTGGGGFYRKVTSFTDPTEVTYCSYYYCENGVANAVVGHFSSNQSGYNIGMGYQRRFGGIYGDSKTKLFAEARYLDVMTPAVTTQPNGLGTTTVAAGTKLIPISVGVRW
jgi:hypothetical protein